MFDGIVRTLAQVWHILERKKNLTSLGPLDRKGSWYYGEKRVLRVFFGVLTVRHGNLDQEFYFLDGYAITSDAIVSFSVDPNSDNTRLWHKYGLAI